MLFKLQDSVYLEVCTISKISYKHVKHHYVEWWRRKGEISACQVSSLARVHSRAGGAEAFLSLCRNPTCALQGLQAVTRAPLPLCHMSPPSVTAFTLTPAWRGLLPCSGPAHPPCRTWGLLGLSKTGGSEPHFEELFLAPGYVALLSVDSFTSSIALCITGLLLIEGARTCFYFISLLCSLLPALPFSEQSSPCSSWLPAQDRQTFRPGRSPSPSVQVWIPLCVCHPLPEWDGDSQGTLFSGCGGMDTSPRTRSNISEFI